MKMPDWWYGDSLPILGEFSEGAGTVGDFWIFCVILWTGFCIFFMGIGILGFDIPEGRKMVRMGSLALPLGLLGPITLGIAAVVVAIATIVTLTAAIIVAWKEKI